MTMLGTAVKLALYDRTRFVITCLGVAFAVTLVLVQVGLFLGILENATVTIDHALADVWITSRNTPNVDFAHPFPDSYVQRVRSVPGVAAADNLVVFHVFVALPSGAEETMMAYGLSDWSAWGLPWDVAAGQLDDLRGGRTMFLDESAARRFGAFEVGDYREVGGTRLRIVGKTRGVRSFTTVPVAFFDSHLLQRLAPQLEGRTTYVVVKLTKDADAAEVVREIRRRMPHNDVYTRSEWAGRTRDYWLAATGLGMNMYVTCLLGCLVGIVVVAQTLYAATMEHLKELGTLKAMGASDGEAFAIIGWQAVVAAVIGFAVALLPAFALRAGLARWVDLDVRITPVFLLVVFVATVGMCLAASTVSLRRIAAIDPALVFRG
jgi:putative ABC transport system permease protein